MYHNLFIARRENRLTQEDVANKLGIHKQTYWVKESGQADFTLKEAFLLADIFDSNVEELFKNYYVTKECELRG